MLKNFQASEFCNQFYRTYFVTIVKEIFAVLTPSISLVLCCNLFCTIGSTYDFCIFCNMFWVALFIHDIFCNMFRIESYGPSSCTARRAPLVYIYKDNRNCPRVTPCSLRSIVEPAKPFYCASFNSTEVFQLL